MAFVGGFVIMSLELLGGRILAPYFGSSIYVWGSIITIFMLALSIGYLLGGTWSRRHSDLRRFAAIFFVAAIIATPALYFNEAIMLFIFDRVEDPRYGSLLASTIMFLPPTVLLGMISPYAVRLLVLSANESGAVAGRLYFISTLGSALGTLGTSFYFVLWFEMQTILFWLIVALLVMGGVGMIAGSRRSTPMPHSTR